MVPDSERLQAKESSQLILRSEEFLDQILTVKAGFAEEEAVRKANRQLDAAAD